ncbi:MAG: putative serine protease HhoB precursor [Parcubacteria group bacterium ADurb.Bin316]|nr:MAG: putative serine protease HhoB precursor [Parcubacteria group bacterium ADurb.Bin316]HOZ56253.1 trypsin-like peptidase domain-containing protein [bacterium]
MKNSKYYLISTSILLLIFGACLFYPTVDYSNIKNVIAEQLQFDEQSATITAIKKVTPAVVSISVIDDTTYTQIDLGTGQTSKVTSKQVKGNGTGFIISADGYILTNKHVIEVGSSNASYKIILNSGKQYYAQLIGKDPLNDLAVLKIFDKNLPYVELGDSDKLEMGYTVIAIGNILGQFSNSATKGIVSGLERSLTANNSSGNAEILNNVIQTDAQINPGNSGGPLVDLNGKVVGINVATESSGASIGFAIPINDAKPVINSIKNIGRIVRVRLGVRYVMITPAIAIENKLNSQSGAWITSVGAEEPAVVAGSPAATAGLQENDIIIEVNGIKIDGKNTLLAVVQKYKPGDKITIKFLRGDKTLTKETILTEFK